MATLEKRAPGGNRADAEKKTDDSILTHSANERNSLSLFGSACRAPASPNEKSAISTPLSVDLTCWAAKT